MLLCQKKLILNTNNNSKVNNKKAFFKHKRLKGHEYFIRKRLLRCINDLSKLIVAFSIFLTYKIKSAIRSCKWIRNRKN